MQGDTLASFLIVITLDYTMRQPIEGREAEFGLEIIQIQGSRHPAIQLTDLIYADVIALVSQEVKQTQQLLISIETEVSNTWSSTELRWLAHKRILKFAKLYHG